MAGSVAEQLSGRRVVTTKVLLLLLLSSKALPVAIILLERLLPPCRSPLRYQARLGAEARHVKAGRRASCEWSAGSACPWIVASGSARAAQEHTRGEGTQLMERVGIPPPPHTHTDSRHCRQG